MRPLVLSDLEPVAADHAAQADPNKPQVGTLTEGKVVTSVTLVTKQSVVTAALNGEISEESTLVFKDHTSRPFVWWACETKEAT